MQAILIVSGVPEDVILRERFNTPLLPLVDRPFLQHVVEYLIEQGINEFDFIVSHLPEKVEALLGDGTRWGSVFRYHLAAEEDAIYAALRFVPVDADHSILLAHADRLPQISLKEVGTHDSIFYSLGSDDWTGWAVLPAEGFYALAEAQSEMELLRRFQEATRGRTESVQFVSEFLDIRRFAGLLDAQRVVSSERFPGLQKTGRLYGTGRDKSEGSSEIVSDVVRLGRGASVAPDVTLVPPVFIGENSHIGAGCRIGPNVVISDRCIVGENTHITEALLLPGSLVGDGLELSEAILERSRLVSVRHGDAVTIADTFLLGDLERNPVSAWASRTQSRLAGLLLLALFWPLLALTALFLRIFRPGPLLYHHICLIVPTTADEADWGRFTMTLFHASPAEAGNLRHFFECFLPGLVAVAAGDLRLVGVTPRAPETVRQLPSDLRALYLRAKAGLISETRILYGAEATLEEELITEGFYSVSATAAYDLRVLRRYLRLCFAVGPVSDSPLSRSSHP